MKPGAREMALRAMREAGFKSKPERARRLEQAAAAVTEIVTRPVTKAVTIAPEKRKVGRLRCCPNCGFVLGKTDAERQRASRARRKAKGKTA